MKTIFLFLICILINTECFSSSIIISGDDYQEEVWRLWRLNAEMYFPESSVYIMPTEDKILSVYQSSNYYYAIAHGDWNVMEPSWKEILYSNDLNKQQFYFAFFGHCDGLCSTAKGTFADSAIHSIGYCQMNEEYCEDCWYNHIISFQDVVFEEMFNYGSDPQSSFETAMNQHPECLPCVKYNYNPVVTPEPSPKENIIINTIIPYLVLHVWK